MSGASRASVAGPRKTAFLFAAAGVASFATLAIVEACLWSLDTPARGVQVPLAALRVALPWTLRLAMPVWVFAASLSLALLAASWRWPLPGLAARRAVGVLVVLAALGLALAVHSTLASYRGFAWYPPFLVLVPVFGGTLGVALLDVTRSSDGSTLRRRLRALAWAVVGFSAFAVVHAASLTQLRWQYAVLHKAALAWGGAALFLGFAALGARLTARQARRLAAAAFLVSVLVAVPVASAPDDLVHRMRQAAASSNTQGMARLVDHPFDPATEDARAAPVVPSPDAAQVFQRASGLPRLPDGFDLADYNVLLVTSESTRFDQTSLADPDLRTTPGLLALAADGAFSFRRAYAPSSGTLHSIAALLSMCSPSLAHLESWGRSWHGELLPEAVTVAELFSAAGYATFQVIHDHKHVLQSRINGFGQGFDDRQLVYESDDPADPESLAADRRIADEAIARIRRLAGERRRFFGWVFFVSPHDSYRARYADLPSATPLERYRHEVRNVDEQLARVVAALREADLLERTVVIYLGDHGEEFGEHGGTHHKNTVYDESIHVPLLVRVPGLQGHSLDAPTSTAYVFPWLLAKGPEALSGPAHRRIAETIAPMMQATGGAVRVELVGHDRMVSALITERQKITYDFVSDRLEVFDPLADPLDQHDLVRVDPSCEAAARRVVDAYRGARGTLRRYALRPDK